MEDPAGTTNDRVKNLTINVFIFQSSKTGNKEQPKELIQCEKLKIEVQIR